MAGYEPLLKLSTWDAGTGGEEPPQGIPQIRFDQVRLRQGMDRSEGVRLATSSMSRVIRRTNQGISEAELLHHYITTAVTDAPAQSAQPGTAVPQSSSFQLGTGHDPSAGTTTQQGVAGSNPVGIGQAGAPDQQT